MFTPKLLTCTAALFTSLAGLSSLIVSDVGTLLASSPARSRLTARDTWNDSVYEARPDSPTISKLQAGSAIWRTRLTQDRGAQVLAISHSRNNRRIYVSGVRNGGGFLAQLTPTGEKVSYRRLKSPARALAIDSSGDVLVGGDGFVERLTDDLSAVFELAVDGRINGLALDSQGAVFATILGGRSRLARLDDDGEGWRWQPI